MSFFILSILAVIGIIALCDQWEKARAQRWQETRAVRREEYRTFWEYQRRQALARRNRDLAPLPWWACPLLIAFHALALWMLIDLWGTQHIWMALLQLGWPLGTLLVWRRRRRARASAQASH